jgi:predicted RND superfamily exporter protein
MDRTLIAVLMLVSGSFALGYLAAWHILSSRISKHRYLVDAMKSIVTLYKEYYNNTEVPKPAQPHMVAANKTHSEMKELLAMIEQPNKNSSHAIYKNKLRDRLMELNTQRLEHLQRAVDSGYDPLIQFNGQPTKMSEVIASQLKQAQSLSDTKPSPPEKKPGKQRSEPTKLSKPRHLSVIKD